MYLRHSISARRLSGADCLSARLVAEHPLGCFDGKWGTAAIAQGKPGGNVIDIVLGPDAGFERDLLQAASAFGGREDRQRLVRIEIDQIEVGERYHRQGLAKPRPTR